MGTLLFLVGEGCPLLTLLLLLLLICGTSWYSCNQTKQSAFPFLPLLCTWAFYLSVLFRWQFQFHWFDPFNFPTLSSVHFCQSSVITGRIRGAETCDRWIDTEGDKVEETFHKALTLVDTGVSPCGSEELSHSVFWECPSMSSGVPGSVRVLLSGVSTCDPRKCPYVDFIMGKCNPGSVLMWATRVST